MRYARIEGIGIIPYWEWSKLAPQPTPLCAGRDPDYNPCNAVLTFCAEDSTAVSPYFAVRLGVSEHIPDCNHANHVDPDTARGQAEYTTTSAAGGHTTVTVHDVTTEGPDPEPLQPDGTWRRVITYTRTVRTRSPETETSRRTGALYLTLAASPDTGQWLITRAIATAEYDAAQTD